MPDFNPRPDAAAHRPPVEGSYGAALARQNARLSVLAEAAEMLMATDDPAAVVGRLFRRAAEHVEIDVYFNYLVVEDGSHLRLSSCAGVAEAYWEGVKTLHFGQAACGTVAQERRPMVIAGVQGSADPLIAFVKGFGGNAYACFPLIAGGHMLGTLSFASRRRASFTQDEVAFLHMLSHYVALAQERAHSQRALATALAEKEALLQTKEMLLRDVDHRIKNSLQLVSALLRMQSRAFPDPALRQRFNEACRRIAMVARVHERLFRSDRNGTIEFGAYLRDLCADIAGSLALDEARTLLVDAVAVNLPTDRVVSLSLIVNELVTNALKHAPMGAVRVALGRMEDGRVFAEVTDEGPGLPGDVPTGSGGSLGLKLVSMLARQLRAEFAAAQGPDGRGARVRVTLPS